MKGMRVWIKEKKLLSKGRLTLMNRMNSALWIESPSTAMMSSASKMIELPTTQPFIKTNCLVNWSLLWCEVDPLNGKVESVVARLLIRPFVLTSSGVLSSPSAPLLIGLTKFTVTCLVLFFEWTILKCIRT
jgi:hypothetical protein